MFLFLFINLFWLWIEGWQASEPSPNVPSSFCLYIHLSLHLLFFSIFPLHAVLIPTYFFLCLRMEGWQMSRLKDKLITLTCPPPCPPPPNNDPHSFFFLIWSRMEAWQVKWACGKLKTWHWHVSSFSSSSFFSPFPPPIFILSSILPSLHPQFDPLHLFSSSLSPHGAPRPPVQTLCCIHIQIHWVFYPSEKERKEREEWRFESTLQQREFMSLH